MFVALTFGDGPHPVHTPKILEILNEFKIKATFFVVGKNVEKQPSLMQRISEKGHQIGNHSFNHQLIPTLLGNYTHEVVKTQEQIEKIVGKQAKLFRPHLERHRLGFYEKLLGLAMKLRQQFKQLGDTTIYGG